MPGRRSGTPASAYQRTADPYSLTWSTVWAAPVPRSSGGRSAVSTSSGTADSSASITAGWKFAAAVPDVHTTATGRRDALARPSAVNAADRSSIRTCSRTRPARSSAQNAMARGVDLDPGATTTSRSPHRASSSASTVPNAVDGFTGRPSPRSGRSLLLSVTAGPGRGHGLRAAVRGLPLLSTWESRSWCVRQVTGGRQRPPAPRFRVCLPLREGAGVDLGAADTDRAPGLGQGFGGDVAGQQGHRRQAARVRQLGQRRGQRDPGGQPDRRVYRA